jgi:dolichol-phosphate mannosyltransferase
MNAIVIIPTYNEAENIHRLVSSLLSLNIPYLSLLIVDDNSPDGTGTLAESLAKKHDGLVRVIHRKSKLGLGTAYIEGFQQAIKLGADVVVEMDADFSHNPKYIPIMLEQILEYDIVVASRYTSGGQADTNWGILRILLSRLGNIYASLITGVKVKDSTSGFKAIRTSVIESLHFDSFTCNGFAFQVEMAYKCERKGFRILEIPIMFTDRENGSSKINSKIIIEALIKIPLMRWRHS